MSVYIGDVQTFAGVIADKPQVLKIGEETMEVFSAWEDYKYAPEFRKEALIAEIADVIQAACNLLAAVGVDDMRQPMQVCYVRNKERGREYSSSDDMDSAVYVQNCLNESCRQYANQVERADLPDCGSDSREKLEAEIYEWCDYHSDELEIIAGWLDRQAAITAIEVARERYDIERDLITARDELQKALNAATGKWAKADAENRELQAENEALKARIESLRFKLSKMLDAASEIQHIGDLP